MSCRCQGVDVGARVLMSVPVSGVLLGCFSAEVLSVLVSGCRYWGPSASELVLVVRCWCWGVGASVGGIGAKVSVAGCWCRCWCCSASVGMLGCWCYCSGVRAVGVFGTVSGCSCQRPSASVRASEAVTVPQRWRWRQTSAWLASARPTSTPSTRPPRSRSSTPRGTTLSQVGTHLHPHTTLWPGGPSTPPHGSHPFAAPRHDPSPADPEGALDLGLAEDHFSRPVVSGARGTLWGWGVCVSLRDRSEAGRVWEAGSSAWGWRGLCRAGGQEWG